MIWKKDKDGNLTSEDGRWTIVTVHHDKYYGYKYRQLLHNGKSVYKGHRRLADVKDMPCGKTPMI